MTAPVIFLNGNRVPLAQARATDLRQWAVDERRMAYADYMDRLAACEGAELAAEDMDAGGHITFAECAKAKVGVK